MPVFALTELAILLGSLSLLLVVTSGWGVLARRFLKLESQHALRPETLWIGLIFMMGALAGFHLFHPIDWVARGVVVAIGVIGICLTNGIKDQTRAAFKSVQAHPFWACCFLLAIVILALKCLQAPRNFDSALYHFQTIKWLNEFSIVPGLGNLHGRLAFNQSYFNLLALLNIQPLAMKTYVVAGMYLFLLVLYSMLTGYRRLGMGGLGFLFVLLLGLGLCLDGLSSPTPDVAIALVQIQIFFYLAIIFVSYKDKRVVEFDSLLLVIALSYLIFTIKISAMVFAVFSLAIMVPVALKLTYRQRMIVVRLVAVLFVFIIIHFLRGYVLSGAPLFPSTVGALWTLPWSMLPENVLGEAVWIYSWARQPGGEPSAVLGNWNWLQPWLANLPKLAWIFFWSSMFFATVDAIMFTLARSTRSIGWIYLLYLPILCAIGFWFFTAPDFRFLGSVPVLLMALTVFFVSQRIVRLNLKPFDLIAAYSRHLPNAVLFGVFVVLTYFIGLRSITFKIPEHLPVASTKLKVTNFGVQLFEATDGLCWDSQLPCTPFVSMGLKYIDPTRGPAAGFTLR